MFVLVVVIDRKDQVHHSLILFLSSPGVLWLFLIALGVLLGLVIIHPVSVNLIPLLPHITRRSLLNHISSFIDKTFGLITLINY